MREGFKPIEFDLQPPQQVLVPYSDGKEFLRIAVGVIAIVGSVLLAAQFENRVIGSVILTVGLLFSAVVLIM